MADNEKYTPEEEAQKPSVQTDELDTDELEDASGGTGSNNNNCSCGTDPS